MLTDISNSKIIHKLLEAQAEKTPDKTAIEVGSRQITFQQINTSANLLASQLFAAGLKSGEIVALAMTRSPEMIVAMLAVLKCGAAYLPLDCQCPAKRNLGFLEETNANILIANQSCDELLSDGTQCIEFNELQFESAKQIGNPAVSVDPEDKAYVMYTSGSTAGPKGVVVPHRAIHRLVLDINYIDIDSNDKILHVSPPEFDASTFEIWGALLNGATVVLYPDQTLDLNVFAGVIKDNDVTITFLTSALFHLIASKYTDALEPLKAVLTGGDVVSPKVINNLLDANPDIQVIACYGPTENTTFSTTHPITTANRPKSIVPIGNAINGTGVHVLDDQMHPVKNGEVGELYTSGPGVALGYINTERNIGNFIRNESICEGLIYRTGDLVKENAKGELEFVGRKDNQIKVRGYRMSLEEIQAAVLELDEIIDATVTLHKHENGEKQLIAYLHLSAGSELKASDIKRQLSGIIPNYMIPDVIHTNVKLLINKNGKIDKKKVAQSIAC